MTTMKWVRGAMALLLGMVWVAGAEPQTRQPGGTDFSMVNQGEPEQSYRERVFRAYLPIEEHRDRLKMEISDYFENPLGIVFQAGEEVTLTVAGGEGQELRLVVHDFTDAKEKWFDIVKYRKEGVQKAVVEELPTHSEYELHEGKNTIKLRTGGLGYLHYRSMNPQQAPQVRVSIQGGQVNGLVTPADSAETYRRVLAQAKHELVDMVGQRIHLVFPVEGLRKGCPEEGPELVALYDRILTYLQDDLMGFGLYGIHTGNHMLVRYLNDDPLCAGETAAFFPRNSFPGMSSVSEVTKSSWGAAHELGHLHQTRPGMMWIGTVEVTNNISAAYVNYMFTPQKLRLEHSRSRNAHGELMHGGIFDCFVNNAITRRRLWQFQGAALPNGLPKSWEDSSRDVFTDVALMWQQVLYHMEARGQRDFFPRIFQAVRSADESKLTQGELRVLFFKRACDAAELDLSDYFVKTGLLAPIDRIVNDYEEAHMTITRAMCDEAVQYAARYPKPESSVIYYINANNMPCYREKRALQVQEGYAPSIENGRMEVPTEACPGAVAFEAYGEGKLLHVSLLGLGHGGLKPASTTVICPPGTDTVKAVGWDGARRNIFGSGETPAEEPLANWYTRTNGIYSLHEAALAGNEEAVRARLAGPQVKHNQYGWIVKSDAKLDPAALNAKNEQGYTPLDLAAAAGHTAIVELLRKAVAESAAAGNGEQSPQ